MAAGYAFEGRIFVLNLTGSYTMDDILSLCEKALADPDFPLIFRREGLVTLIHNRAVLCTVVPARHYRIRPSNFIRRIRYLL